MTPQEVVNNLSDGQNYISQDEGGGWFSWIVKPICDNEEEWDSWNLGSAVDLYIEYDGVWHNSLFKKVGSK